jgi:probable F420-dependent oxidoreductase
MCAGAGWARKALMDIGLTIFPTDTTIPPGRLAAEAEARGFESLFFPEHTHIPVSRRTPYPGGGELPEEYKRAHDPFVTLSYAAAATERLRVGTGVCLVAQRDPIVLAKQVASLDRLSGGRLVFGVGFGWNLDELEDHGVAARLRRDVVMERVLAMKQLWTQDEAEFHGEHVSFDRCWMWPKPLQSPHPPVFLGGAAGPTLFRHIAAYGDGWMPIGGSGLRASWDALRREFEAAGRDPDSALVAVSSPRPDPGVLSHYASLGVTRAVLSLPAGPTSSVMTVLDSYAELLGDLT